MRLATSTLILACIVAFGAEFAEAQAQSDRSASEATDARTAPALTSAEAPARPAESDAVSDTGDDRSNIGPVRWMAPEALNKSAESAAPGPGDEEGEPQTRESGDDGRTDKSQAARARRINSEPCPLPQPDGSDPASTAAGAASAGASGGAAQGCGNP